MKGETALPANNTASRKRCLETRRGDDRLESGVDIIESAGEPKNYPTLATNEDPIPVLGVGSLLLVTSADGTALEAKSFEIEDQNWRRSPIPDGLKVTPIIVSEVVALAYRGKLIDHLAAFSAHKGEWSEVKLVKPVEDAIGPYVGPACA